MLKSLNTFLNLHLLYLKSIDIIYMEKFYFYLKIRHFILTYQIFFMYYLKVMGKSKHKPLCLFFFLLILLMLVYYPTDLVIIFEVKLIYHYTIYKNHIIVKAYTKTLYNL